MTTGEIVRLPTLAEAAETLYGPLIDRAMTEASEFEGVDVEITLMRLWLMETIKEEKVDASADSSGNARRDEATVKLMARLVTQIVRAVAVKYRLSPKKATEFSTAFETMFRYVHEEVLAPVAEEDV